MSTSGQLVDDVYAVVPDLDMPIRVNVVGDDTDLHIIDIVVNPDGIVRIMVESGEEDTVDPPVAPSGGN